MVVATLKWEHWGPKWSSIQSAPLTLDHIRLCVSCFLLFCFIFDGHACDSAVSPSTLSISTCTSTAHVSRLFQQVSNFLVLNFEAQEMRMHGYVRVQPTVILRVFFFLATILTAFSVRACVLGPETWHFRVCSRRYRRANRSVQSAHLVSFRIAEIQQFKSGTANLQRTWQSRCCSGPVHQLLNRHDPVVSSSKLPVHAITPRGQNLASRIDDSRIWTYFSGKANDQREWVTCCFWPSPKLQMGKIHCSLWWTFGADETSTGAAELSH